MFQEATPSWGGIFHEECEDIEKHVDITFLQPFLEMIDDLQLAVPLQECEDFRCQSVHDDNFQICIIIFQDSPDPILEVSGWF